MILPTNTFIATAQAVLKAGGIPRLVDVENQFFGICPKDLSKQMNSSPHLGAIIHVHIGSHISSQFPTVLELAKSHQIPLIEDACQALGASWNGKKAGTFGDFGCFSFFTTKNMTTGEGGMITSSKMSKEALKSLRQFGMNSQNGLLFDRPSGNFKMNEFSALLGTIELKRIDERIKKRRQIAERYQDNLVGSDYHCISDDSHSLGSHYKQMIIAPDSIHREKLQTYLSSQNISLTGGVYYNPLHRQPLLQSYLKNEDFPIADHFADFHFCPPCYPELNFEQVDYVCKHLLAFLKESA